MHRLILLVVLLFSVTACFGDAPGPAVEGRVTLASDVDPAEWDRLEISFSTADGGTHDHWSSSMADIVFPLEYSLFAGAGGGNTDLIWRVDAWLTNRDGDLVYSPEDGEPTGFSIVEFDCNTNCTASGVDLEIISPE
jgi:hypothetical protein